MRTERLTGTAAARYYKLGVTPEDAKELLAQQGYACPICGTPVDETDHLGHDHTTGVVRGFLCAACNTRLGFFRDSTRNLAAAIVYLDRFKPSRTSDATREAHYLESYPAPTVVASECTDDPDACVQCPTCHRLAGEKCCNTKLRSISIIHRTRRKAAAYARVGLWYDA